MTRSRTGLVLAALLAATAWLGAAARPVQGAFANMDISPRARAMGDAQVAVADDAFASYFNPAGLAGQSRGSLATSYVRPYGLSFTDLIYVGGVLPLDRRYGGLGFGVRRFAVSWDQENPQTGHVGSVDLLEETTYTVSHGIRLYEDLHNTILFGSSLNVYHLQFGPTVGSDGTGTDALDPGSGSAVGIDLGLLVTVHERTRLGVLVKNLNNPQIGLDNEEIGQRIHAGVSYAPYVGVVTTFEFENVLGQDLQYHGGLAMAVSDGLELRVGTMTNPSKLTAGFGYQLRGFALNYGFSTGGGTLDGSHQFGLNFSWGGEAP